MQIMVFWKPDLHFNLITVLLFLGFLPSLHAQLSGQDSLLEVYQHHPDDSLRIEALSDLCWKLIPVAPDQSQKYAELVLEESRQTGLHHEDAVALNYLGLGQYIRGNDKMAYHLFEKADSAARLHDDSITIAAVYNNKGLLFVRLGIYDQAFMLIQQGEQIARSINNEKDYCTSLSNLGAVHAATGDYEEAYSYFSKALTLARKIKNASTESLALTHMGRLYERKNESEKALQLYLEAYQVQKKARDYYSMNKSLTRLGIYYCHREQHELALGYLDQAWEAANRIGYSEGMKKSMLEKARCYLMKGQYSQAISLAKKSLQPEDEKNLLLRRDYYAILSKAYEGIASWKNSLQAQQQLMQLEDSLFDQKRMRIISELEIKHQMESSERENQILRKQAEYNEVRIESRNQLIMASVLILLLVSVMAFSFYQNFQQRTQYSEQLEQTVIERTRELTETNQNLERFAYIVSHDLKEPLRNIYLFTQLSDRTIQRDFDEHPKLREYMDYVLRGVNQMRHLIDDILAFSTIDQGDSMEGIVNMNQLISQVGESLSQRIKEKGVKIEAQPIPNVYSYSSYLFIILKNLIENGIKYNTSDQPVITIDYELRRDKHLISVSDNGTGIPAKYQTQIFEMFNRLVDRSKVEGTGMGLAICKKITKQIGGDIWVESKPGEGSTFTFSIPVRNPL